MLVQLLLSLALLTDEPVPPTPEPAEPVAVASASEAAIDAFVAALPPAEEQAAESRAHQMQAELLHEKNPGREFALAPILEAHRLCDRAATREVAMRSVRESARRMGEEKLAQLTLFYTSKDFARFATLIEREEKGMPLGPPETAEIEAMLGRYPLEEFAKVSEQLAREMVTDKVVLDRFGQCLAQRDQALRAAGLNP